jgi:hypothetical protein
LIIFADGEAGDKLARQFSGYELYFALLFFLIRKQGGISGLLMGLLNGHFHYTVEKGPLLDQERRGHNVAVDSSGSANLNASGGTEIAFDSAMYDAGANVNLSFDQAGFSNGKNPAFRGDLAGNFAVDLKPIVKLDLSGNLNPLSNETQIRADVVSLKSFHHVPPHLQSRFQERQPASPRGRRSKMLGHRW